jgi:hypothetical protein
VWPAIAHTSPYTDCKYPPFGQRFRLKASFDTSGYPYQARIILEALKKYGMILADNGVKGIAISGTADTRWRESQLTTLQTVKASDFEAVDSRSLMINERSAQARISPVGSPAPSIMVKIPMAGKAGSRVRTTRSPGRPPGTWDLT